MLATLDRWIYRATASLVIALMAAMTTVIGLQVFCRYVLNASLIWPEELARYAMVWVTCLASALAVRQAAHVGIDSVIRRLPDPARRAVVLGGHLLTLVFLGVVLVAGIGMVTRVAGQTSIALEVPMTVPFAAVPVGAALMLYEYLRLVRGRGPDARVEPR
jgi:TRAP-type C4-dicarboxylate transport system permease small subunit